MITHNAFAATLADKMAALQVLPLHYGSNSIKINNQDLLLVKGVFKSETAWGGDGYAVLVKESNSWQFVRNEEGAGNNVLNWTRPHTEEDAITSLTFMTEKKADVSNSTHLYLLKTHRNYKNSPIELVPAKFTLYVLQPDPGFGIYYFHKVETTISKAKYCNSDSAAYHELGIPLPGDEEEYKCVTPSRMQ